MAFVSILMNRNQFQECYVRCQTKVDYCRVYLLWFQPIKLIQVVSTSEFHEYILMEWRWFYFFLSPPNILGSWSFKVVFLVVKKFTLFKYFVTKIHVFDRELANTIQGITLSLFSATSRHLPNLKHITSCYVIQV